MLKDECLDETKYLGPIGTYKAPPTPGELPSPITRLHTGMEIKKFTSENRKRKAQEDPNIAQWLLKKRNMKMMNTLTTYNMT
jgi:hypothetical protein